MHLSHILSCTLQGQKKKNNKNVHVFFIYIYIYVYLNKSFTANISSFLSLMFLSLPYFFFLNKIGVKWVHFFLSYFTSFSVWQENKAFIERHNEEATRGLHSYTMGMNHFGDMVRNVSKIFGQVLWSLGPYTCLCQQNTYMVKGSSFKAPLGPKRNRWAACVSRQSFLTTDRPNRSSLSLPRKSDLFKPFIHISHWFVWVVIFLKRILSVMTSYNNVE